MERSWKRGVLETQNTCATRPYGRDQQGPGEIRKRTEPARSRERDRLCGGVSTAKTVGSPAATPVVGTASGAAEDSKQVDNTKTPRSAQGQQMKDNFFFKSENKSHSSTPFSP